MGQFKLASKGESGDSERLYVASLAGAWIETLNLTDWLAENSSRPSRARTIADLESALVIRSLCREDNLIHVEIAALLNRHRSFVCRRLQGESTVGRIMVRVNRQDAHPCIFPVGYPSKPLSNPEAIESAALWTFSADDRFPFQTCIRMNLRPCHFGYFPKGG